jgi:hypothetical protein
VNNEPKSLSGIPPGGPSLSTLAAKPKAGSKRESAEPHPDFRKAKPADFDLAKDGGHETLKSAFERNGVKDGHWVRLPAAAQKKAFGNNVIGNKAISHKNGQFRVAQSVGFGQDADFQSLDHYLEKAKRKEAAQGLELER